MLHYDMLHYDMCDGHPRGGRRDVEAATASRHHLFLPTGQQHVASVPMHQMLLLRVGVTKATGSSPDAYANGTALGVMSVATAGA